MKLYPRTSRRTGFTLVELLVTIAILAVLASLVIVGVRKGFQAANAAKLTSNMKSIHTIMMDIVSEGTEANPAGSFPPHSGVLDGEIGASFVWWDLVAEKAGVADRSSGRFKWTEPYANTVLQNPLSKKKLGAGLAEYYSLYGNSDVSRGGYTYNGNLGGKAVPDSNEADTVRDSDVEDAATTIFFAESNDNDTGEGWVFETIQQVPQGNYKDQVHCCFLDGHIKPIKNKVISRTTAFDFYTSVEEKDYDNQPGENEND